MLVDGISKVYEVALLCSPKLGVIGEKSEIFCQRERFDDFVHTAGRLQFRTRKVCLESYARLLGGFKIDFKSNLRSRGIFAAPQMLRLPHKIRNSNFYPFSTAESAVLLLSKDSLEKSLVIRVLSVRTEDLFGQESAQRKSTAALMEKF